MQNASSQLTERINALTDLVGEVMDLLHSHGISSSERQRLQASLCELETVLQQVGEAQTESSNVTRIPIFNAQDIVATIKTATSNEEALRTVMLSTDIPLSWMTIYRRVYPLIVDSLRPQDELPQTGHPGLTRWQYRLSWQMQLLRNEGVVRPTGDGYWMRSDPEAPKLQPGLFD